MRSLYEEKDYGHKGYWTDEEIERWWNRIKDKPNYITWEWINESPWVVYMRDRTGRHLGSLKSR